MGQVRLFLAGAQKCGTSTLEAYLRQHPQLSPPCAKELHFFDDEARDWAQPDYGALEAGFAPEDGRMRYEATPIYGYWPQALARIRAYNPEARLIFLFRDPVARAWSHWCMEYARGAEDWPFAAAIRQGRGRLARGEAARRSFSYVERGYYGAQVARALSLFAREQMLFLKAEDLGRDPVAVLARVSGFLGIAPFAQGAELRENRRVERDYPAWISEADCALLRAEWAQDQALFARLTGLNSDEWRGAGVPQKPKRSPPDAVMELPASA